MAGLPLTFAVLGLIAAAAVVIATRLWPADDPDEIEYTHKALNANHPHLADAAEDGDGRRYSHAFVIDSHHPEWPRSRLPISSSIRYCS